MRSGARSEDDGWSVNGNKTNDPAALDAIRQCLDKEGPIIVEHMHYRGSRAPDRLVFDDIDDFTSYLDINAIAGDAIHVWSFGAVCRDDNELVGGKCPDENGMIPKRGAY